MQDRNPTRRYPSPDLILDDELSDDKESKEEKKETPSLSEGPSLSRTSTTKLSKVLGATFKGGKIEEVETKLFFPEQTHVTIFYYSGTLQRVGVGHISLWDGERLFSYGPGVCWYDASNESAAINLATTGREKKSYGDCARIIMPRQGVGKEDNLSKRMTLDWKKEDYNWKKHNCVHMVEDYLCRLGILNKKDNSYFVFCPGDLAKTARKIGKEKMLAQLVLEEKSYQESSQFLLQRNYLLGLQAALRRNKELPMNGFGKTIDLVRSTDLMEKSPHQMAKIYFDVKKELIKNHYKEGSTLPVNVFSANWLVLSFDLEKIPEIKEKLGETLTVDSSKLKR